ncbi:hypothetical protein D7Y41_19965 [Anaerotruncus sp. 1XD22-93]|nr:hypothetical protein D7Y41_19965 [Anaerotruncus sp. 1XD22-93]
MRLSVWSGTKLTLSHCPSTPQFFDCRRPAGRLVYLRYAKKPPEKTIHTDTKQVSGRKYRFFIDRATD